MQYVTTSHRVLARGVRLGWHEEEEDGGREGWSGTAVGLLIISRARGTPLID